MKTNGKWIYLFYLDKRLVGCFSSAARCVAVWRTIVDVGFLGEPVVYRVKPNWILDSCDVRFEAITEIIRKAL